MHSAHVAAAKLPHAIGRVALVSQLDPCAPVGLVIEGAARGGRSIRCTINEPAHEPCTGGGSQVIESIVALGCDDTGAPVPIIEPMRTTSVGLGAPELLVFLPVLLVPVFGIGLIVADRLRSTSRKKPVAMAEPDALRETGVAASPELFSDIGDEPTGERPPSAVWSQPVQIRRRRRWPWIAAVVVFVPVFALGASAALGRIRNGPDASGEPAAAAAAELDPQDVSAALWAGLPEPARVSWCVSVHDHGIEGATARSTNSNLTDKGWAVLAAMLLDHCT